jgi:hypothetical protein
VVPRAARLREERARLFPLRLSRDGDALELRLRIRLDPPAIALGVASVLVGGVLFGHLLAENLPCIVADLHC